MQVFSLQKKKKTLKGEPETKATLSLHACSWLFGTPLELNATEPSHTTTTLMHMPLCMFVYQNSEDKSIYNLNLWIEDAGKSAPNAAWKQVHLITYHLTDTTHASLCSNSPDKFAHDHEIEHHFKVSAKVTELKKYLRP